MTIFDIEQAIIRRGFEVDFGIDFHSKTFYCYIYHFVEDPISGEQIDVDDVGVAGCASLREAVEKAVEELRRVRP